jgi:hypothetical protein
MNKDFSKLCTPAKIYFAIAVVASVIALLNGIGLIAVATKVIFAFIWTYILAWLCDKGYKKLSWFLVLLPYVLILLIFLGLVSKGHNQYHNQVLNAIKLQGPFGRENFTSTPAPPAASTASTTAATKAQPHKKAPVKN